MRNRSGMFFYPKMRNRSGMFFSDPVIATSVFHPLSLHVVGVTVFVLTLYRFDNTSRMTLYRFGNPSRSSIWYELAYSEARGRIKRGDGAWQIAFGLGFKCCSAVWKAIRTLNPAKEKSVWMDEIQRFPVDVPKVSAV